MKETADNPTILITAATLDAHAYEPVRQILEKSNYPTVVYRTDKVLSGEEHLNVSLLETGQLHVTYNDQSIAPDDVGAAWQRKIANFELPHLTGDKGRQQYVNNEIRHMHEMLWSLYPEDLWLNAPERMRQADRKLGQLLVAHEVGFDIPETLVTGDWQSVTDMLENYEQIVVKVTRGIVSEGDIVKALYTTALTNNDIIRLRDVASPFPGLYQPYVQKAREWRVTVVGDEIFPAAIYTTGAAKLDWRTHQLTSEVEFKNETLPENVRDMCTAFLGRFGLQFGAFDLIENHDGEVTFLECNPNGQYGWLESELGFPISRAIADKLIAIANSTKLN